MRINGFALGLAVVLTPIPALARPAVLLELFTSQGCYSCPPAEKLLAERYLDEPDLLALEFHVDYWDDLVYFGSSWADPFSSPDYTQRQVDYAESIGRNPFTPQLIVQGSYSASGTDRDRIDYAVEEVRKLNLTAGWDIELHHSEQGWEAQVNSSKGAAEAIVVTYLRQASTAVPSGENEGKTLLNHNIVRSWNNAGAISTGSLISLGEPPADSGCALIVQRPDQGVVLGAWSCDAAATN